MRTSDVFHFQLRLYCIASLSEVHFIFQVQIRVVRPGMMDMSVDQTRALLGFDLSVMTRNMLFIDTAPSG